METTDRFGIPILESDRKLGHQIWSEIYRSFSMVPKTQDRISSSMEVVEDTEEKVWYILLRDWRNYPSGFWDVAKEVEKKFNLRHLSILTDADKLPETKNMTRYVYYF